MRALQFIVSIGCVAAATDAHAERVALLSDPAHADALRAALQLALHDADVMDLAAPEGELRLDRAAVAQRTAVAAGADAGVWIDSAGDAREVWVVSADGGLRHAPLPPGGDSPRAFAAIATSLLDELSAPPEDDLDVHVQVDVAPSPPPTAAGFAEPPPAIAPPGLYRPDRIAVAAGFDDRRPVNWNRTLIEVGPMLSPLSGGLDAEVTFPFRERLRLGVMGFANALFIDDHALLFGGGVEARRVGLGRKHTDLGFIAGAAGAGGEPAMFLSARIGRMWESPGSGIGVSLSPTLMIGPDRGSGPKVLPAIWASLHWTFPV